MNSGWIPKTPVTIYELVYLIASFIFFVLPFVSRIKLGMLLEIDRKLNETKEDMNQFKNDMRQMISVISSASATANTSISIQEGMTESKEQKLVSQKKEKTAIELKILNTLWNRQVLKFPDLNTFFSFRLNVPTQEFLEFREAGNRLMGEGLISETEIGHFILTDKGLRYCANHYKEFPADMWFKYIPLDQTNLEKVLKKLGN